jgi:hypothetical protein
VHRGIDHHRRVPHLRYAPRELPPVLPNVRQRRGGDPARRTATRDFRAVGRADRAAGVRVEDVAYVREEGPLFMPWLVRGFAFALGATIAGFLVALPLLLLVTSWLFGSVHTVQVPATN